MITNKNRAWINAFGNLTARGFNFFLPNAHCAFLGALGKAPINSPRTLQHICKPPQANAQSKGFQKSCNFANTPLRSCNSLKLNQHRNDLWSFYFKPKTPLFNCEKQRYMSCLRKKQLNC